MVSSLPKIICLMGPTATGKTNLAVQLVQQFPCDIISVDSAMVYRGLNIGAAKPDQTILKLAPHRLIDIVNLDEIYSAGDFRADALHEINSIIANHRVPLLVGGTMLYFRVLQQGIAELPKADEVLRRELKEKIARDGLEKLHQELMQVDPVAAKKIHPRDKQRIQRALEVYYRTGKPISAWQHEETDNLQLYDVLQLALIPNDRAKLHANIALRFQQMLNAGLVDEVREIMSTTTITRDHPAMRSVGYRQVWSYLCNEMSFDEMRDKAIAATRQLAKRQMTWLRSWPNVQMIDSDADDVLNCVSQKIKRFME